MDFSDKYIQMCEQAAQLQASWIPAKGDWIVERRCHDGVVSNHDEPFLLHDMVGDNIGCLYVPQSQEYGGVVKSKSIMLWWRVTHKYQDKETGDSWWYVWLPQQDQLQALPPSSLPFYSALSFALYIKSHMEFETMEEAWLTNIMCWLHHSYWVEGQWVSKRTEHK